MNYEEFLQCKAEFIDDVITVLAIKAKHGLSLTDDEKVLRRHLARHSLEKAAKLLGIEQ